VICVDSGYEIHYAGAAGLDIKGTEVLGHAKTEDEALEIIVAVVQMYREQAHYLERIYKWARRIGHDEVKQQIIENPDRRREYFDRFVESQKIAQTDPWTERVNGVDENEFTPLRPVALALADKPFTGNSSDLLQTQSQGNTLILGTDKRVADKDEEDSQLRVVQ